MPNQSVNEQINANKEVLSRTVDNKPLQSRSGLHTVSERMASVYDALNAMGQERTFRLNNKAKTELLSDDTVATSFFGKKEVAHVKGLVNNFNEKEISAINHKIKVWNRLKTKSQVRTALTNYERPTSISYANSDVSETINHQISKMVRSLNEKKAEHERLMPIQKTTYFNELAELKKPMQIAERKIKDLLKLKETDTNIDISKEMAELEKIKQKERAIRTRFNKQQAEATSVIGDANKIATIMQKSKSETLSDADIIDFTKTLGKHLSKEYGNKKSLVRSKKSLTDNPMTFDDYDNGTFVGARSRKTVEKFKKEIDSAINTLSFKTLPYSDFDGAVNGISDNTLKEIVRHSYEKVIGPDGQEVYRPYDFLGLRSATYGKGDSVYHIPGYLDIESQTNPTNSFDYRGGLSYLDQFDARGFIDNRAAEQLKVGDGENVTPMNILVDRLNTYQQAQRELTIEQKKSRYLDFANRNVEVIGNNNIPTEKQPTPVMSNRIRNLFEDVSLIEGTAQKQSPESASALKKGRERLAGISKKDKTKSSYILEDTIETLAQQEKFPELRVKADEFRTSLRLFKNFQDSVDKMDLDTVASSIRSGANDGTVFGIVNQLYKKVLQKANIPSDASFESMSQERQIEILGKISDRFVSKLDMQLGGIQSEMSNHLSSPVVKNMYNALNQHQSDVWREHYETEDIYEKGIMTDETNPSASNAKRIEEEMTTVHEQSSRISKEFELLRSSWEEQGIVQAENIQNNLSNTDMKEFRAAVESVKNNYMLMPVDDLSFVQGRGSVHATHFTYEELAKGSVTAGQMEIPLDRFKQKYSLNSMRKVMGKEWTGFTQGEWDSGMVSFGKTTMPITQFAEYYEPNYRKPHIARAIHNKNVNAPISEKVIAKNIGLSPAETRILNHYINSDTLYSNEKVNVLVKKNKDEKLIQTLTNAHDTNSKIVLKGSVIPYSVDGIIGDELALLKSDHVKISDLKFELSSIDGENMFEKILEAESFLSSKKHTPGTSEKTLTVSEEDVLKNINREFAKTSDGKPLTRKMLHERFVDKKTGLPQVAVDTAKTHFSWIGASDANTSDLGGVAYFPTLKAFSDVGDADIVRSFAKFDAAPSDWLELSEQTQRNIINDAFSYQTKVNTLLGFMEHSSDGDKIDSVIRVAKNIAIQNGHDDPGVYEIQNAIMDLSSGLANSKDKELKSYFSIADKLKQNDSLIRERLVSGGSKQAISVEYLSELQDKKDELYDPFEAADKLLGPSADVEEFNDILEMLQKEKVEFTSVKDLEPNHIEDLYQKQIKKLTSEKMKTSPEMTITKENLTTTLLREINSNRSNHKQQIKAIAIGTEKEQAQEILGSVIDKIANKDGVDPGVRQAIIENKERIVTQSSRYFTKERNKLGKLVNRLHGTINKVVSQPVTAITPGMKLAALKNMEINTPGSAAAYISNNGGLIKAFADIFGIGEQEVSGQGTVKEAFKNLTFDNVEDFKNFSVLTDIIPGLELKAKYKDEHGNLITGSVGHYKDALGRTDNILRTPSGDKIKMVNATDEAILPYNLNGKTSKDVSYARENVAKYHSSTTNAPLIAGFSGNYDKITRRPYGGTSGVDAIVTLNNLKEFKDGGKTGILFDFETTGLPNMPKGFENAFAPIEMAYLPIDSIEDLKPRKSDIMSAFVRPNETVKSLFDQAIEKTDNDFNIAKRVSIEPSVLGSDNAEFMLLRNYAKYDTSRITVDGEKFTAGSLLTSKMTLSDNGTVISHIGDRIIDTKMNPFEIVERTKQSAKGVFDYLSKAGLTRNTKKYGIDPADVMDEKEFVELFSALSDQADLLLGHNISTADIPWSKTWSDRNGVSLPNDIETRLIDTQDVLQASNSGRRFNNLESYAENKSKSHLATADVATNAKLIRSMLRDKQIKNIMTELDQDAITAGDYLVKNNANHIGMMDISDGVYKVRKYGTTKDGRAYVDLLDFNGIGKDEVPKIKTFYAENLAVIRKEFADNWSNYKADIDTARAVAQARIKEASIRTMNNAYTNGKLDRYYHYSKTKNFDAQRNLVKELKTIYDTQQRVFDGDRFVASESTHDDLLRFVYSNKNKLDDQGYTSELLNLANIAEHRSEEFERLGSYLDSDEGRIIKKGLDDIETRVQTGLYSHSDRESIGREIQNSVKSIKEEAISSGLLGKDFMIDIPDRFNVGSLTLEDLTPTMREHLKGIAPWMDEEKALHMTFDSAEQIKGDIFKMGESIAQKIIGMDGVESIEEARQRVTNEVILPKLKSLSKDKKLIASIDNRKLGVVDDEYKSMVYTFASEVASRRDEMKKKFKPLQVLDMTKPLNGDNENHLAVIDKIKSTIESKINKYDQIAMSFPNPDKTAEQKLLPIPGGMEKLKEIVTIQEQNKKALIEALQLTDALKNNKEAAELLANGVFSLPGWNTSALNSGGRSLFENLGPIEFRETNNKDTQWMRFKTADELTSIADSIRVTDNENSVENVFKAFLSNDKRAISHHQKNSADIIDLINSKLKGNLSDESYIRTLNESTIRKISDQFKQDYKGKMTGNISAKSSIFRELWKRASLKDENLKSQIVTPSMIENNPTKYNAMKAIGMLQEMGDNSGNWYTGSIGLPDKFSNTGEILTLDPSRIRVPGNREGYVKGAGGYVGKEYVNSLAGRPLTSLASDELNLITINPKAPYNKELFRAYEESIKGLPGYDESARELSAFIKQKNRKLEVKNVHSIIPGMTETLSSEDYTRSMNEAILNRTTTPKNATSAFDVNSSITKSILDNDNFNAMKDGTRKIKEILGQHKKGIMMGSVALAVLGGLALTSKRTSNGRTPEQQPISNQAPNVDGTYDKEYNKNENTNEHFIPKNKYMKKTIHLEEGGRGLNVRARGVNRKGLSDDTFDNAVSDTMRSTLGADVNISHSDNRSSIDNNYIQGLVSNALFG